MSLVKSNIVNALCIDVDDICYSYRESGFSVKKLYFGADKETEVLLEHLEQLSIKATFFVPGLFVAKAPKLVQKIVSNGHELASHGWIHRVAADLGRDRFRQDVIRSKKSLEDLSGEEVCLYKAPIWGICANSIWALDILYESGFKVDHSLMPAVKPLVGMDKAQLLPFQHSSGLTLIPPTAVNVFGRTMPMPGGFYGAYAPLFWLKSKYREINNKGLPFNFYFHPFEHNLAQGNQQFLKAGSFRVTLTTAHGGRYRQILSNLAGEFSFGTLTDSYQELIQEH